MNLSEGGGFCSVVLQCAQKQGVQLFQVGFNAGSIGFCILWTSNISNGRGKVELAMGWFY